MQLFRYYMVRLLKIASANNVRVKMIGDRSRFDRDIIDGINRLESETQDNTGLTFVIAVNYGGRDEIRRAAAGLARDCALAPEAARASAAATRSAAGWQETAPLERRIRTRWMRHCLHRIWIRRECRTRTF